MCTVGGTSSELAVRVLLTPPQVELVSLGKTAIDLPALRGPLWVLMKPEFISLDGVRDPVEGLVVAGVEPVFASYLDNQVDEYLTLAVSTAIMTRKISLPRTWLSTSL